MLWFDTTLLAIAGLTFLVAGLVKGLIGLGLPTVSVAVLSATVGLPMALPLMVVPSVITNLWQAIVGGALLSLLRRFWSLLIASVVGVFVAYSLFFVTNTKAMTALLGIVLCVYSGAALFSLSLVPRVRRERLASPTIGLVTGLLAGATGSMVMPVVAYLQTLGLSRDEFVQMMGISFAVSTAAIGLAVAERGNYEVDILLTSTVCLAPALVGMQLGQVLRRRISEELFRRCVHVGLFAIGLHLIWKGLA
ncbi:MAG: sulfite exporter TauE/SafE family protein [Acidiferrobacterales bacterium]